MYPTVNESDPYAGQSHPPPPPPPQGYVLQGMMPSYYGIPQPQPQPYAPPYITTNSRAAPRAHHWSTGLCRCLDDPGICKNL